MIELREHTEQQLMLLAAILNVTQTYINHVALEIVTPSNEMRGRILRAIEAM